MDGRLRRRRWGRAKGLLIRSYEEKVRRLVAYLRGNECGYRCSVGYATNKVAHNGR